MPAVANVFNTGGLLLVTPRPPPVAGDLPAANTQPPVICKSLFADTADGFWLMEAFLQRSNDWGPSRHEENRQVYAREMGLVDSLLQQRPPTAKKVKYHRKALAKALGHSRDDLQAGLASIVSSRQDQRAALLAAINARSAAISTQAKACASPSSPSGVPPQVDADISRRLAALEAELAQLAAFDAAVKRLAALDARIKSERDKAARAIFEETNRRPFISRRWKRLLHGMPERMANRKYPDSFPDPRRNGRNKSPLDLLAFIDLHGQSGERVQLIFSTLAVPVLSLYGWVLLITGRGAHSRGMTFAQFKGGALSPLKRRVLHFSEIRGVGVVSFASSPGVLLLITHQLYEQALARGMAFEAPVPDGAA